MKTTNKISICDGLKKLLICFILISCLIVSSKAESCKTPKNVAGTCIRLRQCSSLLAMLYSSREDAAARQYLLSSRCGNAVNDIYACCPFDENGSDPIDKAKGALPALDLCGLSNGTISTDPIANPDEFPWIAQLIYKDKNGQEKSVCSGVLINQNFILTAAHCVDTRSLQNKGLELFSVRLGDWDKSTTTDCVCKDCENDLRNCADPHQDFRVNEVIAYDEYSPTAPYLNDIALVRINGVVSKITRFVRPICLPSTNTFSDRNSDPHTVIFAVAGWGHSEKAYTSNVMLKGTLVESDQRSCQGSYSDITIDSAKHLCAGGRDTFDTCYADDGSPLMQIDYADGKAANWRVIGILSTGPAECITTSVPAVYTRVKAYTDWIASTLVSKLQK